MKIPLPLPRRILIGIIGFGLVLPAIQAPLRAEADPRLYAVEVSATIQTSPAQITLNWPARADATRYTVYRKSFTDASWGPGVDLPGSATSYNDQAVAVGGTYEYQVRKTTNDGYTGYGYVYTGIEAPLVEFRGRVVLIVANTHAAALANELARLQQDLVGDGWTVVRHDVSPNDTPAAVKAKIKAEYDADRANTKAVFLFGHVPVAYSGDIYPDGHVNHRGAWPADVYYAEMDGIWTDRQVTSTDAERDVNWNVPGDGKFDQSVLPSDVDLQIGRVDLFNMTNFANKSPPRSELDLLRQYLNKNHNFRHRRFTVERRGLIVDHFGLRGNDAVAASGYRNFSAFFGSANVHQGAVSNYLGILKNQSYLCTYGAGGGSFYYSAGVATADDFSTNDIQAVFNFYLGSYYGDWNNESNFLRSSLGCPTYTLAVSYSGFPHSFFHHMGLGASAGYGILISQNNRTNGTYLPQGQGTTQVHISLLGDPTLRLHPVIPPGRLTGTPGGGGVNLSWAASTDSDIRGYHVYRAPSANGPFTRISGNTPLTATTFFDSAPGVNTWMVRAIKLERSGSGTYFNASQGVFFTGSGGGTVETPPAAPTGLSATAKSFSQINLSWTDASSNENGFKLERKVASDSSFNTIATLEANATSYQDTGLAANTEYVYRLRAFNNVGNSDYSNEARATTPSLPQTQAEATLVRADSNTRGTWTGVYGAEGFVVIGSDLSIPSYAELIAEGHSEFIWNDNTDDLRALQKPGAAPQRIAACWYAGSEFVLDLNINDSRARRVALYFLDWDSIGRGVRIDVTDAGNGQVLNSQTLTQFSNGQYLVWDIKGHVRIRVIRTAGPNAIVNGIFFDALPAEPIVEPVTLSQARVNAGNFEMRIIGKAGQKLVIEASPDLKTWSEVAAKTLVTTSLDFSDPASSARRFYRVRSIP
ncbi:MAG: fibronectin type III domain-containing protein [Verrucomicrobiota bacterium]